MIRIILPKDTYFTSLSLTSNILAVLEKQRETETMRKID